MGLLPAEAFVPDLERFERLVTWLYRDTAKDDDGNLLGHATTGIGELVATEGSCCALPWQRPDMTFAGRDEMRAYYAAVMSMPPARPADSYQRAGALRLNADFCRGRCAERVRDEFLPALRTIFGSAWTAFPEPAQRGCLDMVYTLGARKLAKGFPSFVAACARGDWAEAANQCHRKTAHPDRPDDRNAWCRTQFLAAAGQ